MVEKVYPMFPDDKEMAIAQCALAECVAFHQAYPSARSAIQDFNEEMGIEIDDYCDVEAQKVIVAKQEYPIVETDGFNPDAVHPSTEVNVDEVHYPELQTPNHAYQQESNAIRASYSVLIMLGIALYTLY